LIGAPLLPQNLCIGGAFPLQSPDEACFWSTYLRIMHANLNAFEIRCHRKKVQLICHTSAAQREFVKVLECIDRYALKNRLDAHWPIQP
jgi:hypothetical protein